MNKLPWVEFVEGPALTLRIRPICIFIWMMLLFVSFATSFASDSVGVSSALLIRLQLRSIADEVIEQANLDIQSRVAVMVEGEEPRSIAENAFFEALQKRNYMPVMHAGAGQEQVLHVILLGSDIRVRQLDSNLSERLIHTTVDVRTMKGKERDVRVFGIFTRESKDTAHVFSSIRLFPTEKKDESGVVQRLLSPLAIIGSAILVVYLFFTVRS